MDNIYVFSTEQIRRSFSLKEGYSRREVAMQRLFISVAALQFALSVATAQPAPTSTVIQSASLDQRSKVDEIIIDGTAKPLVPLELLSAPETVVVLPVVALHLLLTGLIAGATSESGIASVYAGGRTASGESGASIKLRIRDNQDENAPLLG